MHSASLCAFLIVLTTAAGGVAQSVTVPAANETARGGLGLNTLTRNINAPRTYMMGIDASHLTGIPAGTPITGLSFRASVSTSNAATWPAMDITWANYDISVGPCVPLPTWSTTFASNFASTPQPVRVGSMVLEAGTFTNNSTLPVPQPNRWGDFYWDFQTPYTYTGGDLAILVTHTGSNDSAAAIFIDGITSAGTTQSASATTYQAATGVAATFCVPRIHYGYGRGCPGTANKTPNLVLSNNVTGGGSMTFAAANGLANAPAVWVIGVTQQSIPLFGCTLLNEAAIALPVSLSNYGRNKLSATFVAGQVGTIYAQMFVVDAGAPSGIAASLGAKLTVSP